MKIAVAGCGAMGRPMAECLIAAGYDVVGYDVRPRDDFGSFAEHMTDSATELASADVLISIVRDAAQTRDLARAVGKLPPVVVLSSTLSPRFVRAFATEIASDVTLIDAPMSGAPHSARSGQLSFMIGGPDDEVLRLKPMFGAMGATLHLLGPLGAGATAKVLNNFVAASCVAAVRTVLAQSDGLGLKPERLRGVLDTSSGGTWYGTNLDRIDWAHETYDPANTIGILEKDVTAYLDAFDAVESPDELTAAILSRLRDLPALPE